MPGDPSRHHPYRAGRAAPAEERYLGGRSGDALLISVEKKMPDVMRQVRGRMEAERMARRPIIVAVGATGGVAALRMSRALVARDASDVVVVSVVEPPPIYALERQRAILVPWTIGQQLTDRRQSVHQRLHRLGWSGDRHAEPSIEVLYGDTGHEIADLARERDARLLVMGIGPHTIGRRLLATGTALATNRRASCPVLAVAERANDLPRVVVVATDFSPESIHAVLEALPLLADGAVIHLVHAWTRVETLLPIRELTELNDAYAASLPERFDRLRTALGRGRSLSFNSIALEGKPAEMVLAVARSKRADLVVAGTHGYGMLARWLVGSTSTALLRGAECSVLLVPEPPVAERTRLLRHMTGTSTVRAPEEWDEELRAFVRRNHDRRTSLEIDDRNIGAQVQETGYALVGATYDPHDHHIALMFGGGAHGRAHLTRSLGNVRSVAVASGPRDEDRALCIESDGGCALLTFLDQKPSAELSVNA